jgi:hypothetical protein
MLMDIIGIIIWDVNGWYPHHGMLVVTGDIYIYKLIHGYYWDLNGYDWDIMVLNSWIL